MEADEVRDELKDIHAELKVLGLEMRAGFAEARVAAAEDRTRLAEYQAQVNVRFDTLFQAIADFRSDYNQHWHPPTEE